MSRGKAGAKQCDVEGCDTGKPYAARGKCQTHYMQLLRFERGEGRAPGETKQIAKPGEGDQVTFKLDKSRKGKVTDVAERQGVDPSELYREGVDLLLALHTDRSEKWRKIRALLNAA
jgi:hypothetical protein